MAPSGKISTAFLSFEILLYNAFSKSCEYIRSPWVIFGEKNTQILIILFLFFRASYLDMLATSLNLLLTCWLLCPQAIK